MIGSVSREEDFHNHVDEFMKVVNRLITDPLGNEMISETTKDLKTGATNYLQETSELDSLVQKQIRNGLYERGKNPDETHLEAEIVRAESLLNGALEAIVEYIEDESIDPDVYTEISEALDTNLIKPLDAMDVAFSREILSSDTVKLAFMETDSVPSPTKKTWAEKALRPNDRGMDLDGL